MCLQGIRDVQPHESSLTSTREIPGTLDSKDLMGGPGEREARVSRTGKASLANKMSHSECRRNKVTGLFNQKLRFA